MTELRVEIPDDVARRLNDRAAAEATTPEQLASDAVRSYLGEAPAAPSNGHRFAFIGVAASGRDDLSERVEELLAEDLDR